MLEGKCILMFLSIYIDIVWCRGATPETVKKAFEILLADPKVKSIFINIFGGTFVLVL
jgi:succinyl-CoA synthetase beta subunit